jgi:hypothetical protein
MAFWGKRSVSASRDVASEFRIVCERAFAAGFNSGQVYQKIGAPDLPECKPDSEGRMNMDRCSAAILRYTQEYFVLAPKQE